MNRIIMRSAVWLEVLRLEFAGEDDELEESVDYVRGVTAGWQFR